ncbi:MAG: class I SAM-dependent methyltransferase [Bacteroidia bacterium]|nr:class I SAM-dependent methyltransferase [Bacteroidia bacterium]
MSQLDDFPETQPFDLITMWHYLEHDYTPSGNPLLSFLKDGPTPPPGW